VKSSNRLKSTFSLACSISAPTFNISTAPLSNPVRHSTSLIPLFYPRTVSSLLGGIIPLHANTPRILVLFGKIYAFLRFLPQLLRVLQGHSPSNTLVNIPSDPGRIATYCSLPRIYQVFYVPKRFQHKPVPTMPTSMRSFARLNSTPAKCYNSIHYCTSITCFTYLLDIFKFCPIILWINKEVKR